MTYLDREKEALRLIAKYGQVWMMYDNEAIGEIMSACERARLQHNPKLSKLSTYLITAVKHTMYKLNQPKKMTVDLQDSAARPIFNPQNFYDILACAKLTDLERDCLIRVYLNNERVIDIAHDRKCSKQNIYEQLQFGLSKLRKVKHVIMDT